MRETTFRVGDRVAYTAAWLRSAGMGYDVAQLRGEIIGIKHIAGVDFALVDWGDDVGLMFVHPGNLCRVRSDGLVLDAS